MERHTTFVEGFANNDYFEGAAVGQIGDADGFHAGVLVRFPLPSGVDLEDAGAADEEYLLFGNGDFTPGNLQGWAISALQQSPVDWIIRFSLVVGAVIQIVEWGIDATEIQVVERGLFVEAFWEPAADATPLFGMYVNGVQIITDNKDAAMVPSTLRPRIGGGPQPAPLEPVGAQIEPRGSIGGVCYRTSAEMSLTGNEALVWERVQETDDITQLPEPGAVQWDNIWSARRGLPAITGPNQVWSDLTGDVDFVRTGGGNTLEVNAAKAHWWNQ